MRLALLIALLLPGLGAAAPLSEQIDEAAGRAVAFLRQRQQGDGSWTEASDDRTIGQTALVTLALLSSGESKQSDAIRAAAAYLRAARPTSTYSTALRASVMAQLPRSMRGRALEMDVAWLQRAVLSRGPDAGMYTYGLMPGGEGRGDFSNSQYGVLGVWYAAEAGVEIPMNYWRRVEAAWRHAQADDGGWGYLNGPVSPYASMTAAGAATLFITDDYLHFGEAQNLLRAAGRARPVDRAIEWLGRHFAVDHNPGLDRRLSAPGDPIGALLERGREGRWVHYMLFAFERVGEASGLTRFGEHRWFERGAQHLLRTQRDDGAWHGSLGPTIDTAYALLFLSRGRSPVILQKLRYAGRWNNRSRDAANFIRFMRRATERHLNWQIVDADADLAEWREAPLLLVSGDRPIELSPEQRARLGRYVAQGGLVVAVNEGRSDDFARGVELLCEELFPGYRFADAPPEHPIFTANFPMGGFAAPVRTLSNGVRDLVVLIPSGDATWLWQSNGGATSMDRSVYAPLANLHLHVTDQSSPRMKGDDFWPAPSGGDDLPAWRVARARFAGNFAPEPLAWQRVDLDLRARGMARIAFGDLAPDGPAAAIVHLSGTGDFTLDAPTLAALRRQTDAGALLLIDPAGGDRAFLLAAERLLRALFPQAEPQAMPPDHPALQAAGEWKPTFRRFDPDGGSGLWMIERDGRPVAILSRADLTAALVGYEHSRISGFRPESARRLAASLLRWQADRGR